MNHSVNVLGYNIRISMPISYSIYDMLTLKCSLVDQYEYTNWANRKLFQVVQEQQIGI